MPFLPSEVVDATWGHFSSLDGHVSQVTLCLVILLPMGCRHHLTFPPAHCLSPAPQTGKPALIITLYPFYVGSPTGL